LINVLGFKLLTTSSFNNFSDCIALGSNQLKPFLQLLKFFRWHQNKQLYLLTFCFLISRIAFRFAGVIFYGEFVKRLWQAIDVALLKSSLMESLYYSHAQPPLFNLLSGLVLKVFPHHYSLAFHVVFLIIGWLNVVLIYLSLRKLKVPEKVSLIISLLFMMLPSVVLYENLYSYTYINIFLLSLTIFLLLMFVEKQNAGLFFLFCGTLCALVLLRSFYHVAWLIFIVVVVLCFHRKHMSFRKLVVVSVIPMIFVFGWLIKNYFLFGSFSTSTWIGMNLARVMPSSTALGTIGAFKPIDQYPIVEHNNDYPSVRLLHEVRKSNTGYVNYFHIDYIQISQTFKNEVLQEIKSNPSKYFRRVRNGFLIYCSPATHAPFIDKNYSHISRYAAAMDLNFTGYRKFVKDNYPLAQAIPMMMLYILLFLCLCYCFWTKLFLKEEKIVVVVLTIMILYSIMIGTFLEYGENNRFRFEQLSVFLLLFVKTSVTIYNRCAE
jgi:hypothetical protein